MEAVNFPIKHPVLEQFESLYAWASEMKPSARVPVWDHLIDVAGKVFQASGQSGVIQTTAGAYVRPNRRNHDGSKALVMFSGGKDSTAAALELREAGKQVAVIHVVGLNGKSYRREVDHARDVARAGKFPFRIVRATRKGHTDQIENPTKNILLAALGAALADQYGAGTVALGALEHDAENATNFACGLSDDPSLIALGGDVITWATGVQIIPAVHQNDAHSYKTVWTLRRDLLQFVGSCMLGPRAHAKTRQTNEAKYQIALLPGRCGSCYKCCFELVCTAALEGRALPRPLALHCVEKMRAGLQKMRGQEKAPTAREAIEAFFEPEIEGVDYRTALSAASTG